jgi:hypothetical protein
MRRRLKLREWSCCPKEFIDVSIFIHALLPGRCSLDMLVSVGANNLLLAIQVVTDSHEAAHRHCSCSLLVSSMGGRSAQHLLSIVDPAHLSHILLFLTTIFTIHYCFLMSSNLHKLPLVTYYRYIFSFTCLHTQPSARQAWVRRHSTPWYSLWRRDNRAPPVLDRPLHSA